MKHPARAGIVPIGGLDAARIARTDGKIGSVNTKSEARAMYASAKTIKKEGIMRTHGGRRK